MGYHQEERLAELLMATAEGSRDAFKELYSETQSPVFRRLMTMVSDRDICAQLLEGIFIKVWAFAKYYPETAGDPLTWIMEIAREEALQFFRISPAIRRREVARHLKRLAVNRASWEDYSQEDADQRLMEEISRCLLEIPATLAQVLELSYCEGMATPSSRPKPGCRSRRFGRCLARQSKQSCIGWIKPGYAWRDMMNVDTDVRLAEVALGLRRCAMQDDATSCLDVLDSPPEHLGRLLQWSTAFDALTIKNEARPAPNVLAQIEARLDALPGRPEGADQPAAECRAPKLA